MGIRTGPVRRLQIGRAGCKPAPQDRRMVYSKRSFVDDRIQDILMPKLKTHKGAAKRFKKTGTGKIKRRHAFARHILTSKSRSRKRRLGQSAGADPSNSPE